MDRPIVATRGASEQANLRADALPPVWRAADRPAIQSGYPVFARPDDPANDLDLGRFVGVVDDVIERRGAPYLHVRGGLEQARDLFLPLGAVRTAANHQVRLNVTLADLLGQARRTPPTLLGAM